MRRHFISLVFSLAFIGLVLLAFNPNFVVGLQQKIFKAPDISSEKAPEVKTSPETSQSEGPHTETQKPETESPQKDTPVSRPPKPAIFPKTANPNPDDLPRLKGYENIPKGDPWIDDAPCGLEILEPPEILPSLSSRRNGEKIRNPDMFEAYDETLNQESYLYSSADGVTLRLVQPIIKYYDVKGRNFRAAQKDIFDRQPLKPSEKNETGPQNPGKQNRRTVVLANIAYPISISYIVTGRKNKSRLLPEDVVISVANIVTLPRWTNYRLASSADKEKWDDLFCNAIHHEFGHLRIHLDLISETLNGYAYLPSDVSTDEITKAVAEYSKEVSAAVEKRQNAYHLYNGGGLRRGMIERPYAALPFPWLKTLPEKE